MTMPRSTETAEMFLTRDLICAARYYLGGRRGLLVLAGLAILAGLALNWGWLVTAGIAPILIGVLPCLAMCALGLCMNRGAGKSCSTAEIAPDPAVVDNAVPTLQAVELDVPRELVDREPKFGSDAAPPASREPRLFKERRPTDA